MLTNSTGVDFIRVEHRMGEGREEKRPARRDHRIPPDTYEKGGTRGVKEGETRQQKNAKPNLQWAES